MNASCNWIPADLVEHDMCGAFAVSFLAHVIVGSPLPLTLDELRTNHTNMRASFAQAIYTSQCCRCAVVRGNRPSGVTKQLITELLKHGVPDEVVQSRAHKL